ncbi:MAG: RNA polymerase sigma factor [Acidobacteriota bacterium]
MVGLSERYLVRRLRRGEREACRELIARHHKSVYAFLRHRGADPDLAEDLTQETYAKAWRYITTLRRSTSLRSWLLTIARNEFLQWVRAHDPECETTGTLPDGRDGAPDPQSAYLLTERQRALRRAVNRLQPELRETVALHYFHDLSLRECGSVLGLPAGTVKSRVHRALGCLRGLLEGKEAEHETRRIGKALAHDS